ncbi:hypothetical protein AOR_1_494114 [Paecilomyces variotii No. 5]|uniref:Uncharacterized protein n=1 Tax=Byssochlamys spectabilis (strain No. 5 / NBRC 109023) TaxID=1356009 RepID=V5FQN2_BYSSN|nr:hypothetical protein AOR_1_494114 [Paecilomyces variotii No. 5]
MDSTYTSSASASTSGESSASKIPLIILDSDDDDDDVQIVEVRSVQKGHSHDRSVSSGCEPRSLSPSRTGVYRESTSPTLKREIEQTEAERTSSPPKRHRREPENDTSSYTKDFFLDLADTIGSLFPVDSFAARHGCSSAEVYRAIRALVVSPLMDPSLHEMIGGGGCSSIEEYGRMMIEIWKDRYRKMVKGEDGSEGSDSGSSGCSRASIKRCSEPQENAVKTDPGHLVTSGGRQGIEGQEPAGESGTIDNESETCSRSSLTASASEVFSQYNPIPRVEKEEPTSARRWMERDAFGIYVESERSGEDSEEDWEV